MHFINHRALHETLKQSHHSTRIFTLFRFEVEKNQGESAAVLVESDVSVAG